MSWCSGLSRAAVMVAALFALSCSSTPTAPSPDLRGGVVATFAVGSEQFKIFVTNTEAIAQLIALRQGAGGLAKIPNGRIHRGAGAGNHNAPYSWHLDPSDIEITALTIELCDGAPSYVEANVGDYVDTIKRYCPWGARLESLADYR